MDRDPIETRNLERQNAHLAGASLDTVSDLLRALRALVPGPRAGVAAQAVFSRGPELVHRALGHESVPADRRHP